MIFCHLLIFFQNQLFEENLVRIPSECQTVRSLIRSYDSSSLNWFQRFCQNCQQTPLVDKELRGQLVKYMVLKCWLFNQYSDVFVKELLIFSQQEIPLNFEGWYQIHLFEVSVSGVTFCSKLVNWIWNILVIHMYHKSIGKTKLYSVNMLTVMYQAEITHYFCDIYILINKVLGH